MTRSQMSGAVMDEHDESGVIPAWELQELLQRTQAQGRRGALDLLRALVEAGVMDGGSVQQRTLGRQAVSTYPVCACRSHMFSCG